MKYVVSIVLNDGTKLYRTRKNDFIKNKAFTKNINEAFIFTSSMNDGCSIINSLKQNTINFKHQTQWGKYNYDGVEFCISEVVKVIKEKVELKVEIVGVVSEQGLDDVP